MPQHVYMECYCASSLIIHQCAHACAFTSRSQLCSASFASVCAPRKPCDSASSPAVPALLAYNASITTLHSQLAAAHWPCGHAQLTPQSCVTTRPPTRGGMQPEVLHLDMSLNDKLRYKREKRRGDIKAARCMPSSPTSNIQHHQNRPSCLYHRRKANFSSPRLPKSNRTAVSVMRPNVHCCPTQKPFPTVIQAPSASQRKQYRTGQQTGTVSFHPARAPSLQDLCTALRASLSRNHPDRLSTSQTVGTAFAGDWHL